VAIPQLEWRGVRYSVPPRCLGQRVEVRQEVSASVIEVRFAGEVVARHRVPVEGTAEVWDASHWSAAQAAALGRGRGRHLQLVSNEAPSEPVAERLEVGGDVEVAPVDLGRYDPEVR
jgi:hypothetical protein